MNTKFDTLPADRLEDATRDVNALMDLFGRKSMTAPLADGLAQWGVKRCSKCLCVKHLEDFSKLSSARDGLSGRCNECNRAGVKDYRKRHPEYAREYHAANRERINAAARKRYAPVERAPIPPQVGLTEFDLPFATNVVNGMMEILGVDKVAPSVGDVFRAWGVKRCHRCTQIKHPESFNKNARNSDGLESECRDCQRERARRYAAEHREYYRERTARWRENNQIRRRLYAGKVRAERAGAVAEEFTEEDLLQHWESQGIDPTRCFYTGEELTSENISIDHKTPFKRGGEHTMSNLVPCTWAANDRKNTRTAEEFQELLAEEKETNTND